MDCIITVKGDGRGQYGHSKHDRTETIQRFLVHNQVLYTEVFKHVVKCDKCDPNKILECYFSSREKMKISLTSSTFVDLVRRYELNMSSRLTQNWLKKLILSSVEKLEFATVCANSDVLSKDEVNDFLYRIFIKEPYKRSNFMSMASHLMATKATLRRMHTHKDMITTFVEMCGSFGTRPVDISYEEYINLASVAEILIS